MAQDTRASSRPVRRTQAERREATRTALLDATIECLVEYGYAEATTARVADLAGVSRGAQVHYFANKAAMVTAAVDHLAQRRIAEFATQAARLPDGENRPEALLDLIWDVHQGDIFVATIELWVAARVDPQLHAALTDLERGVSLSIMRLTAELLPGAAQRPGFRDDVEFVVSSILGLALLRITGGENTRAMNKRWRATRERLARLIAS
ncbi:HTH-type transcriptional regulator BetI [Paraconexibacter sp. AEG42_29]|uniref:HTH-type transcriptional regulator BetI n=1 Tax=Paraconexibacter sp. AEG42_29 TaxID=2997339 RepID=A0AAU7AUB2_9ACTN